MKYLVSAIAGAALALCSVFYCPGFNNGQWQVVAPIRKPTSVRIVVLNTRTGEVEAYEVPVFDQAIPQVTPVPRSTPVVPDSE